MVTAKPLISTSVSKPRKGTAPKHPKCLKIDWTRGWILDSTVPSLLREHYCVWPQGCPPPRSLGAQLVPVEAAVAGGALVVASSQSVSSSEWRTMMMSVRLTLEDLKTK